MMHINKFIAPQKDAFMLAPIFYELLIVCSRHTHKKRILGLLTALIESPFFESRLRVLINLSFHFFIPHLLSHKFFFFRFSWENLRWFLNVGGNVSVSFCNARRNFHVYAWQNSKKKGPIMFTPERTY